MNEKGQVSGLFHWCFDYPSPHISTLGQAFELMPPLLLPPHRIHSPTNSARKCASLCLTILMASLLVACNGNDSDSVAQGPVNDQAPETVTPGDIEPGNTELENIESGALEPGTATPETTTPEAVTPGAVTPVTMAPDSILSPLPDPPLTQAPSADDEPVPFDPVFHTITAFQALRDTGARLQLGVAAVELSEADFNAALPEPVITVPEGVDPNTNAAPFFEGLDNVRIAAGDILELRFVPRDPEGDLPGMFPQELPEGATFNDNFDGTRTLRWQPLQGDIGITSFTAVAIDPLVSTYRSSQTVLIAVDEPADPSSIPNVAPQIRPVTPYTVRQGDPVSIFIVGVDRNGTVPSIELQDPPQSATLTPDARTPEWQILQVVPDTVGQLVINVLTRDALDPLLTGLDQITLNVRSAEDFERPGTRLREIITSSGREFGSAISPVFYMQADGGVYEAIAGEEFGVMSPESSMKWSEINPLPGDYEFADMDTLMNFAQHYAMQVRGHTLVWHNNLPAWVEATAPENREVHMREFITRIMARYADRVSYWDVVNEPISEVNGMRDNLWFQAMGESYIDIAFHQARILDPAATLVLNEFDIGFAGRKFDDLLALLDRLLERNVPIDAIGFQMHIFSSFDQFDEFADNMAAIAERGLDIHITEFDVAMVEGDTEATQAMVYQRVAETCLEQPRCTVFQVWGFTDRYSFRRQFDPLILDRDFQSKPAYIGLQNGLGVQ